MTDPSPLPEHYEHFCTVISKGPATELLETVGMVMDLSNGMANPLQVGQWWHMWRAMRQAMKDNHPMVKLAAVLAPVDLPVPKELKPEPISVVPAPWKDRVPGHPDARAISYVVSFWHDCNSKGPGGAMWVEMGPIDQQGIWDAGSLPMSDCIQWATDLIAELVERHVSDGTLPWDWDKPATASDPSAN